MLTILIASADGQPKRKIPAHFAKKLGILSKPQKSDICHIVFEIIMFLLINSNKESQFTLNNHLWMKFQIMSIVRRYP